jgi:ketosteroid isomerase-like protein
MKRALLLTLTIITAIVFAACNGGIIDNKATNGNANNTNAAKTTASAPAPTKEALMALETKASEAWKNKDGKFWEGFLADNFVGLGPDGKRYDKAALLKMMSGDKCEVKSYSFSDDQMIAAGADAAILTYKITADYKCPGQPSIPNSWGASVFVRSGDTWKAAYYNEMPIPDPNAKPADAPKAPPAEKKTAADDKKAETEKDKPAAPPSDDALVAAVKKGWEAWKNRDAKALGDVITKDFVLIDPMAKRYDHDGAVKSWTEQKCEIKSVSFADEIGTPITKDMGIVTLKGVADGTCDGHPAGSLFGSYIMVKDGDTWKAAMIFETLAM